VDRREGGVQIATIAGLLGAGERVLVLVADVALRRDMLDGPLHPARFGARAAYLFSERCAASALADRRTARHCLAASAGALER